jgi:hypothetical protein
MTEPMDFDRALPCYTLPRTNKPNPEPAEATPLWRLRAWELESLPRLDRQARIGAAVLALLHIKHDRTT